MTTSQNLDEIRAAIRAGQARCGELHSATLSHAEIRERSSTYFKNEANGRRRQLAHSMLHEPGSALVLRVSPQGTVDLTGILGALLGVPAVVKALMAPVVETFPDSPAAADRIAALEAASAELFALEVAEEAEVIRLEATGQRVLRRADARPEIVLAMPESPAS